MSGVNWSALVRESGPFLVYYHTTVCGVCQLQHNFYLPFLAFNIASKIQTLIF